MKKVIKKIIWIGLTLTFFLMSCMILLGCGTISVTLDYNDGSGRTETISVTGNYLQAVPSPQNDAYYFGGWWTAQEGGEQWDFGTNKVNKGLVLYARWLQVGLTVRFDMAVPADQTLVTSAVRSQQLASDSKVVRPKDPLLESDRYCFKGWSQSADIFIAYNFEEERLSENLVLYAHWDKKYSLRFESHTAEVTLNDAYAQALVEQFVWANSTFMMPKFLKDESGNYLFSYWCTDSSLENTVGEVYSVDRDTVFYAKWDKIVHVNFDVAAQEGINPVWPYPTLYKVRQGETLYECVSDAGFIKPENYWIQSQFVPYDQNYEYAAIGWFYTQNGKEKKFSLNETLHQDTRVYVKWRKTDFHLFDGKYREVYYPQDHPEDWGDETPHSSLGNLPERDAQLNGLFVGWFYKNSPQTQYFGERVPKDTQFVSKVFQPTAEKYFNMIYTGDSSQNFDVRYVAVTLSPTFTDAVLVVPPLRFYYNNSSVYVHYNLTVDLNQFPNIDTVVFYGSEYNNFTFPKKDRLLACYMSDANSYLPLYDFVIYTYNGKSLYNEFTPENQSSSYRLRNGYLQRSSQQPILQTSCVKLLPVSDEEYRSSVPVYLENRFLPHYNHIKDTQLYCAAKDLATVQTMIESGQFLGCTVSVLESIR